MIINIIVILKYYSIFLFNRFNRFLLDGDTEYGPPAGCYNTETLYTTR